MLKQYKLKDYNFRLVLWPDCHQRSGNSPCGKCPAFTAEPPGNGSGNGACCNADLSLMDFSWILNFYWIIYFGNIIMLLAVRLFGSSGGATRWIDLGFVRFQPTELSKILLIMFFAKYFMEHEDDLNTFRTLVQSVILLAVPLSLLLIQPDLKNTITVVILFCTCCTSEG